MSIGGGSEHPTTNATPRQDPAAELMRLVNGYQVSQALHVVATLGIADLLRAGGRTSDDLAAAVGAHPQTLYRVLRGLAAVGVFHEGEQRRFTLTALGDCLRSDAAAPISPWAVLIGRPYFWQAWSHLLHSVRTGGNAFSAVHGVGVWEYRAANPDEGAIFNAAMTALSRGVTAAVIACYDFARFGRVVDVGGGAGALLGGILAANAGIRGVLFDQPHVVADAAPALIRLGVMDRCELVGGDFFERVPEGDLVVLKAVLHDWDDADAIRILQTCRQAIRPGGRLLVVERLIGVPNEAPADKFSDLTMLVVPGGQERTAEAFAGLFAAAGFTLSRVVPTATHMNLIEGVCG